MNFQKKNKPKILADVGCNDGLYSFESLKAGAEKVIGFDNNKKVIKTLKDGEKIITGNNSIKVTEVFRNYGVNSELRNFWPLIYVDDSLYWVVGLRKSDEAIKNEKRYNFINWTVLLAILGFSFSMFGTFIVSSGMLTSVHAFASDPWLLPTRLLVYR